MHLKSSLRCHLPSTVQHNRCSYAVGTNTPAVGLSSEYEFGGLCPWVSGFRHGQQFNCHVARGELTLIQANLVAHFPAEERTALLAETAGEIFDHRNE